MEGNLPLLSVGEQEFKTVRLKGMIYVDKTGHFPGLEKMGKTVFLSRPRRFGKSLTATALDAFFSGETGLFEGLAAHGHMVSEAFVPRPVVKMDMTEVAGASTAVRLETRLGMLLKTIAQRHCVRFNGIDPPSKFLSLLRGVSERYGRKAVVLVDEYDTPVLKIAQIEKRHRNEALLRSTREIMRNFYTIIKTASNCVDFTFITGVTKFSGMGVFSELNNVTDISLMKDYAELTGFTQEELESHFGPHFSLLAESLETSKPELMERIREWYNGFSFDGETRLYNPYSIISLIVTGDFSNFWIQSGSKSIVMDFFRNYKANAEQFPGMKVSKDFAKSPGEIESTTAHGFLYQAGYLSLRKISDSMYSLEYPNREVRTSVSELFIQSMLSRLGTADSYVAELTERMRLGDACGVATCFFSMLASICYDDFSRLGRPARRKSNRPATDDVDMTLAEWLLESLGESFYRCVIASQLTGAGADVIMEPHTNRGRADIVAKFITTVFVIEMKVAKDAASSMPKAAEGISQIGSKGYAERYPGSIRMSVAIDSDRRNIGACIIVKDGVTMRLVPDGLGTLASTDPDAQGGSAPTEPADVQ